MRMGNEEIEQLHINYERGFYCEFRSSEGKPPGLYAGKKAPEGVWVIEV